jgi:hypothetical protein
VVDRRRVVGHETPQEALRRDRQQRGARRIKGSPETAVEGLQGRLGV